jgi:hypothetical protein
MFSLLILIPERKLKRILRTIAVRHSRFARLVSPIITKQHKKIAPQREERKIMRRG